MSNLNMSSWERRKLYSQNLRGVSKAVPSATKKPKPSGPLQPNPKKRGRSNSFTISLDKTIDEHDRPEVVVGPTKRVKLVSKPIIKAAVVRPRPAPVVRTVTKTTKRKSIERIEAVKNKRAKITTTKIDLKKPRETVASRFRKAETIIKQTPKKVAPVVDIRPFKKQIEAWKLPANKTPIKPKNIARVKPLNSTSKLRRSTSFTVQDVRPSTSKLNRATFKSSSSSNESCRSMSSSDNKDKKTPPPKGMRIASDDEVFFTEIELPQSKIEGVKKARSKSVAFKVDDLGVDKTPKPSMRKTPKRSVSGQRNKLDSWLDAKASSSITKLRHLNCMGTEMSSDSKMTKRDGVDNRIGKAIELMPNLDLFVRQSPILKAASKRLKLSKSQLFEAIQELKNELLLKGHSVSHCCKWMNEIQSGYPACVDLPVFWVTQSLIAETGGDVQEAKGIYERAIEMNLEPKEELEKAYAEFKSRLGKWNDKENAGSTRKGKGKGKRMPKSAKKVTPEGSTDGVANLESPTFDSTIIKYAQAKQSNSIKRFLKDSNSAPLNVMTPVRRSARLVTKSSGINPDEVPDSALTVSNEELNLE